MTEPIYNMRDVMKRIKTLQVYNIERDLPEDFNLSGKVPYDIKITEDKIFLKVYAISLDEANQRVDEYLSN